jgi:GT2 family glycosyltransferase
VSEKILKIATLCCCYNRIAKTTVFLDSLIKQSIPENYAIDYFLLDDHSPDNTGARVKMVFPQVNVLQGSGSLFWAGGMRTLWEHVLRQGEYDFYLLLNDDVVLSAGALERLLAAYRLADGSGHILLGTVLDPNNGSITYGGRKIKNFTTGSTFVQKPDAEQLKVCEIGNANIMLVDRATVNRIGILTDVYTHGFADFDYTYAAVKNGLNVWVAPGYYGHCENDHGVSWLSGKVPLKKRIAHLYSPKGLAFKEYRTYIKRNFLFMLPAAYFLLWLKTLFPAVYDTFKKERA